MHGHERIHGPYQHRARWRVVAVGADGRRVATTFARRSDAERFILEARAAIAARTVGSAVTEFLADLERRGRRPGTLATARHRLVAFLRLTERDIAFPVGVGHALAFSERRKAEVAPDTHRGELALVRTFAAWCIRRGYLTADPWERAEPAEGHSVGKPQLRLDEARRFLARALDDGTEAGLAVALALLTGARASEVTDRLVRDLDDGGRLLWIPTAKTRAGVRYLAVPEALRPGLAQLAKGRKADDRLFSGDRHWLAYHVQRLCKAAGVEPVTPHGLRGLHATVAVQFGAPADLVARALGHAGTAVTRRHYLAPGTEAASATGQLAAHLGNAPGQVRATRSLTQKEKP